QPETGAAAIADQAIQGVYHRQDGKKADTLCEATPAFRFRAGLGRPTADQLFTSERVDNAARVDRHVEGRTIDGRGPASLFFGRAFQAPELPPLKNFEPVVK
ncbi:hypothetical protein L6R52_17200, partial [Myxococcota bacterium]|nr:hypothetical protein [Myxococcota bacterium]